MDDFESMTDEELIEELVGASQETTLAYEWGTGTIGAQIRLDAARKTLLARIADLRKQIAYLVEN